MARSLSRGERRRIQEAAEKLVGKTRYRKMSRAEQAQLLAEAAGAPMGKSRYARGRGASGGSGGGGRKRRRGVLRTIFDALGKAIFRPSSTAKDVVDAIRMLMDLGFRVDSGGNVAPPEPPPSPTPLPQQVPTAPTTVPTVPQPGERRSTREAPQPGEEFEEILTPQSSNVYSFSYVRQPRQQNGTLYVTFKAPKLNPDAVKTGRGRLGGKSQLRGKRGSTVIGKTNDRGPMYAYYNVPPGVFKRMRDTVSKGKFVWDNLRVRGTVYGHQYRYSLTQGAVINQPGVSGTYVPRKATKKGFRVRSVAEVGQGRRGYESSTLAGQEGFRSRRRR